MMKDEIIPATLRKLNIETKVAGLLFEMHIRREYSQTSSQIITEAKIVNVLFTKNRFKLLPSTSIAHPALSLH